LQHTFTRLDLEVQQNIRLYSIPSKMNRPAYSLGSDLIQRIAPVQD